MNYLALLVAAVFTFGGSDAKTIYDCDFDADFCGWVPGTSFYLYDWKRMKKGTPHTGTGPIMDASRNVQGHFANVHVLQEQKDAQVSLASPSMISTAPSSNCELHFSHSLYVDWPKFCKNKRGDSGCARFAPAKAQACPKGSPMHGIMAAQCAKLCGIGCGRIKVTVANPSVGTEEIFSSPDGANNKVWTPETVKIPSKYTGKAMEVTFEAYTGWDKNSYIAIDNIYFTNCNMFDPSKTTTTPTPTTTTTTPPTTTTTLRTTLPRSAIKPEMYDCDYEQNTLCRWNSHSPQWTWGTRKASNINNWPKTDGSGSGNGHFVYMKVTRSQTVSSAHFVSPLIDQFEYSPNCHLTFQYYTFSPSYLYCKNAATDSYCKTFLPNREMFCAKTAGFKKKCGKLCGEDCQNFKVYVTNDISNLGNPILHERQPRDNKWYPFNKNIGARTNKDFQVVFEGMSGKDSDSYIAVDNIKFTGCETKIKISTAMTTTTTPAATTTASANTTTATAVFVTAPVAQTVMIATGAALKAGSNSQTRHTAGFVISPDAPQAQKDAGAGGKSGGINVIGLVIGSVVGVIVVGAIIAGVMYHLKKKKEQPKMLNRRMSAVGPTQEAWK